MGLEYNGAYYHGWQSQQDLSTVQSNVETALSKLANQAIQVHCAGRTDVGVHATAQVIHFDSDAKRSHPNWIMGANTYLDPHIRVLWVKEVAEDFHARFKAIRRRYRYIIYNNFTAPGIFNNALTWVPTPLCEINMALAAECFLGEHNFNAYRSSQCQARNPVRMIYNFKIYRCSKMLILDIEGNGFLHHMVRNIAGVLIQIGQGKRPINWAEEVLISGNRSLGAATASPKGLYLVDVVYPDHYELERPPLGPVLLSCQG